MKFTFTTLLAAALAAGAVPISAGIIDLLPANANCNGCNNILFQLDDFGNPLTASTQAGRIITISQSLADGNLFAPSNGQARVEQQSGDDFHGLFIDLGVGSITRLFEFTVQPLVGGGRGADPAETMLVDFVNNNNAHFSFPLGSVGQNRHTWQATGANEFIRSVTITFVGGTVQSVEQIRLGEAAQANVGGGENPEPASVLLMGGGLLACGIFGRKRLAAKRSVQ